MIEDKPNQNKDALEKEGNPWWKAGVEIFSQISTWIIVPIVSALIFGKMIDSRLGTEPIIFLFFAGFGFLITCFGIFRVIKKYIKEIKETEKEVK